MTQRQIEELLNQHADRLVEGQRSDEGPLAAGRVAEPSSLERAGLSADEQRSLSSLMHLARRVQTALVEVEPGPAFVADLKSRLVAERRSPARPEAPNGRAIWWVAGVAGALSVAGLGFLGYRAARARAGAGWVSPAAAGRNAPQSLPKV
jgi:hypothetical protein